MSSRARLGVMGFVLVLLAQLVVGAGVAQASSLFFVRSGEIWVANPDGSGAKQVTSDGGSGEPYVWVSTAKGGKPLLAYLRDDTTGANPRQSYGTMNPDGTGSTVNPDNNPNMQPYAIPWGTMVSIDVAGDRVAWPSARPQFNPNYAYYFAYSVGVDGTNEAHLLTNDAQDVTFGDPAGQTLLFQDLSQGYNHLPAGCVSNSAHPVLVLQTPVTGSATPGSPTAFYCAAGGADLTEPTLRPDGQMIAAVQGGTPGSIVTIPIGGGATAGSASPTAPVTPAGVAGTHPDFSPDGGQIAFEGAGSTIDTVPASGGAPTQALTNATSPAWSPYTLPGGGGGGGSGGGGGGGGGGTPPSVKCHVPRLKGKTRGQASRALATSHCALGKVTSRRVKHARKGRVISQSPAAGQTRVAGTKIRIVLAR